MSVELKADPRTGLEIVEIPASHVKYFSMLQGSVIHWFGEVDKYNRMWKPQKRVAIISDMCIYLCRLDGTITRCVHIPSIQEIIVAETALGFRVAPPDYDMLIKLDDVDKRETFVQIISKIFWCTTGRHAEVRQLNSESGEAMQQNVNLTKPDNFANRIEPLKSAKALTRLIIEKEKKEQEDRKVVEREFERIKDGLALELQRYREEEYDEMTTKLETYVKILQEKDKEIEHLKATSVSLDDPEVWRRCPNCAQLRRILETHPNDDKQKIFRLQREVDSQRHIVEHLQTAIQHRSGGNRGEVSANAAQINTLRTEVAEAARKNKELQMIILESPFLTADVKQRAARLLLRNQESGPGLERVVLNGRDATEALLEKEREIRHLKDTLRDVTFKHVQELERCREQIKQYDEQVLQYVTRLQAQPQSPADSPHRTAYPSQPQSQPEYNDPFASRGPAVASGQAYRQPSQGQSGSPMSIQRTPIGNWSSGAAEVGNYHTPQQRGPSSSR